MKRIIFGITVLLFVALTGIASASQIAVTLDPAQPVAGQSMTFHIAITPSDPSVTDMAGLVEIYIDCNQQSVLTDSAVDVPGNGLLDYSFTPQTAGQYNLHLSYFNGPISEETGHLSKEFTVVQPSLTPLQEIKQMKININSLVSAGKLKTGSACILLITLDAAKVSLKAGMINIATTGLNLFKFEVNSYIKKGIFSLADGQLLIDEANNIIAAIK